MTHKFYNRFLTVICILFIPSFFLNEFRDALVKSIEYPFFWSFVFYSKPILAATLLYFGIYAHVSKVKTVSKGSGPLSVIVVSIFFVLLSFVPPILHYSSIRDTKTEFIDITTLQRAKEDAMNISTGPENRLAAAALYYENTGQTIEYLAKNYQKAIYSPDKSAKERRKQVVQLMQKVQEFKKTLDILRARVIALISIAAISSIGFIMFLRYKSKKSAATGKET